MTPAQRECQHLFGVRHEPSGALYLGPCATCGIAPKSVLDGMQRNGRVFSDGAEGRAWKTLEAATVEELADELGGRCRNALVLLDSVLGAPRTIRSQIRGDSMACVGMAHWFIADQTVGLKPFDLSTER